MKRTDDYHARLGFWARDPKPCRMPRPIGIPHFGWKKFNSYEEMNAWKKSLLKQIARQGGVKWKR
jgi:hypothetical protein